MAKSMGVEEIEGELGLDEAPAGEVFIEKVAIDLDLGGCLASLGRLVVGSDIEGVGAGKDGSDSVGVFEFAGEAKRTD